MKIVADPNIPFVREAFSDIGEIQLVPGRQFNPGCVRDADALLVRSVTPVNAALLEGSKVQFVATATIGTDHVDCDYLAKRGIGFASAAGSNANSVAEYVVAALLEMAKRKRFPLRDKTLGIIGVGNVGKIVVRYAEALGMRVLQNDPPRQRAEGGQRFVSFDRILAESDFITLHVPLIRAGEERTRHLFDEQTLGGLTQQPILINSSRGSVVDNEGLTRVIRNKILGGVVLDVWENEPNISLDLLNLVDIATPHIAGYSFDGKVNGTLMIYRAVCQFLGQPATWDPSPAMPEPSVSQIEIDSGDKDDEEVFRETVRRVYDIRADDVTLRQRPQEFDRLRAEYPMRREFSNTLVRLGKERESLREMLRAVGFPIAEIT